MGPTVPAGKAAGSAGELTGFVSKHESHASAVTSGVRGPWRKRARARNARTVVSEEGIEAFCAGPTTVATNGLPHLIAGTATHALVRRARRTFETRVDDGSSRAARSSTRIGVRNSRFDVSLAAASHRVRSVAAADVGSGPTARVRRAAATRGASRTTAACLAGCAAAVAGCARRELRRIRATRDRERPCREQHRDDPPCVCPHVRTS